MTYWLAWEEPRAVGDLVHVEKFFARNLGGLIHARPRVPGRLGKATSRTPSMYVDEKSDEAIVLASPVLVSSKPRPLASTAQAMRASLLASAIASTLWCNRLLAASIQDLSP